MSRLQPWSSLPAVARRATPAVLAGVVGLGAGCDVLIGLGEEPSGAADGTTASSVTSATTTTSGAGGDGGGDGTSVSSATASSGSAGGGGAPDIVASSAVAADRSTCALLASGAARCWGPNQRGQLGLAGIDTIGDDERPTEDVTLGQPLVGLDVGELHACGLFASGAAICWGAGDRGQMGHFDAEDVGDDETPETAGLVVSDEPFSILAAGAFHTCALGSEGKVWCWGRGTEGQLGDGAQSDAFYASAATTLSASVALAAGDLHTCALDDARTTVTCWGAGADGRLGHGDIFDQPDAQRSFTLSTVIDGLTAGARHTCAWSQDLLWCWGAALVSGHAVAIGDNEEVGDDAGRIDLPLGEDTITSVSAGAQHTCILLGSGEVRCWGRNADGRLGVPGVVQELVLPQDAATVDLGGPAISIAAGRDHTCAVREDGALLCWGDGQQGRLGYGREAVVGDDETPAEAGPVL